MIPARPDPNRERNDPLEPDLWRLGEALQDAFRARGYEPEEVEGIAVDVHDLLQSADRIRAELVAAAIQASDPESAVAAIRSLAFELDHIRWHCDAALAFLTDAERAIGPNLADVP